PLLFQNIKYIVIDELHAFIGTERGKQLQSIMHRIDILVGRKIPRVGLSATIGDISIGAHFLRPHAGDKVALVKTDAHGNSIKVQLRAYVEPNPPQDPSNKKEQDEDSNFGIASRKIAQHMFDHSRGKNNLIFPNSRSSVEVYTLLLNELCEQIGVPKEYWPHHGSLSKQAREETEFALKDKSKPSSAICTSTLELGIDIGEIDTVFQIGCPPSVASLRQRLGRSGRREGVAAILRGYTTAYEIDSKSSLYTRLRIELFQFTAMIDLLLENWFEPPNPNGCHFSTFIQQLLSMIAQYGGVSASKAYKDLIETGPFSAMQKQNFIALLRHLGANGLIEQDASGLLLSGNKAEPFINHYSFYSAFQTDEEFRLYHGTDLLGTMPISSMLSIDQILIFSGRKWKVTGIDEDKKVVNLVRSSGGKAPMFMSPSSTNIHSRIRERMKELYSQDITPRFLDQTSIQLLNEGRGSFDYYQLKDNSIFLENGSVYLFTWSGDSVNQTIAALLRRKNFIAENWGAVVGVTLQNGQCVDDVYVALKEIHSAPPISIHQLLADAQTLRIEKWDWALPDDLLQSSYASLRLDIDSAYNWIAN
ncbi:MAG: hypothetical protein K2X29_05095, partial [Candidatus Obscuribacterales bacterium]|nr:hypothetical protein [Candidatus Obscuribacterales bacterium]